MSETENPDIFLLMMVGAGIGAVVTAAFIDTGGAALVAALSGGTLFAGALIAVAYRLSTDEPSKGGDAA